MGVFVSKQRQSGSLRIVRFRKPFGTDWLVGRSQYRPIGHSVSPARYLHDGCNEHLKYPVSFCLYVTAVPLRQFPHVSSCREDEAIVSHRVTHESQRQPSVAAQEQVYRSQGVAHPHNPQKELAHKCPSHRPLSFSLIGWKWGVPWSIIPIPRIGLNG